MHSFEITSNLCPNYKSNTQILFAHLENFHDQIVRTRNRDSNPNKVLPWTIAILSNLHVDIYFCEMSYSRLRFFAGNPTIRWICIALGCWLYDNSISLGKCRLLDPIRPRSGPGPRPEAKWYQFSRNHTMLVCTRKDWPSLEQLKFLVKLANCLANSTRILVKNRIARFTTTSLPVWS